MKSQTPLVRQSTSDAENMTTARSTMAPSNRRTNRPLQRHAAGILLLGVLVIGCQKTSADPESGVPEPATSNPTLSSTDKGGSPMSDLQNAVKKDMAYADLRKLVLDGGWEPVKDPQCQVQVAGYDEKTCEENPGLALCTACEQMPELSAYTGDGFATSRFKDVRAGKTLKVVSYGMIEDWNVLGEESRLRVEEWESADTQTQQ